MTLTNKILFAVATLFTLAFAHLLLSPLLPHAIQTSYTQKLIAYQSAKAYALNKERACYRPDARCQAYKENVYLVTFPRTKDLAQH
jgi:hypothetical protein